MKAGSVRLRKAQRRAIVLAVLTSYAVAALAVFLRAPLWLAAAVTLAPWLPFFVRQVVWTRGYSGWLALFYVLVIAQSGHMLEHVVQMVQLHIMHLPGAQAHGVVGVLDNEWVHFGWNGAVAALVFLLVTHFRRNPWLWLTSVLTAWHEVEHLVIMWAYLTAGLRGAPGLLAQGGALRGGLPIATVDLHFYYNLLETVPLLVAFGAQCRQLVQGARVERAGGAARRERVQRILERHVGRPTRLAPAAAGRRLAFEAAGGGPAGR